MEDENQYLDWEGLEYYHNHLKEQIPSKTSQLQNDSQFITAEDADLLMQRMLGIIPMTDDAGLSVFFTGNTQLEDYTPPNEP